MPTWGDRTQSPERSSAAAPSEWRLLTTLPGDAGGGVWGVALAADGRLLACTGEDRVVRVWETNAGRPLATLRGHTGAARGVSFVPDGRMLASGGADGMVRLWETSTGFSTRTSPCSARMRGDDVVTRFRAHRYDM